MKESATGQQEWDHMTADYPAFITSNVTGRHRGLKRKLRTGYRAPSRNPRPMCRHSYFCPIGRPSL